MAPLPPNLGGILERAGGHPPNPRQRGFAPYGIPIFMFHGVGGNPSMADFFENVILNEVKNLSLRESDNLHLPRPQGTRQLPEEPLQGYFTPVWLHFPPILGG